MPEFAQNHRHHHHVLLDHTYIYRVGEKRTAFSRVDNFAMVNGKKVCVMSKVSEFCLKKV